MANSNTLLTKSSEAKVGRIDRRRDLALKDFESEYLYPHLPVIIEDATKDWPALQHWTPDWFKQRFETRPVVIDETTYKLGEFIDEILSPDPNRKTPYLRNQAIHEIFPELAQDILPSPIYVWPNWLHGRYYPSQMNDWMHVLTTLELFVGGKGSQFPSLHIDSAHTHAFLNQVYGTKELILYPPDQSALVYPNHKGISQVNDIDAPDLDLYPRFAEATPYRVTVKAGDTILIPSGWWHTARMPEPSITVSVNTANASNWKALVRDASGQRGAILGRGIGAYLTAMGAWNRIAGVGRGPSR